MQAQLHPLLVSGTDSIQSVIKAIGLPQQNFPFHTDQQRSVETYTLQALARGKQQYTGFTLTTAMASSNAQIFTVFPFTEAQAIKFMHQYFDFDKEIAVQTPAQSPPGYVEVKESETETTLNRYALGATTTVQELKTAKGQFIWRGKLIIVSIAFIETAELLAIQALLTTPSIYAQYFVASGQHSLDLARAGRIKKEQFDILHTRDNGFSELVDMYQQEFSSQNVFATHCILTEGMRSLMMASDMKKEYYRNGPGAAQNAAKLGDAIGDVINEVTLIVVRPIELRKKDLRIAPLEHLSVNGQHWRIDHFYQDCDLTTWCSRYLAIQVFSMEHDMNEEIGIEQCLYNDMRFDKSDGKLSSFHHMLARDADNIASTRGVPVHVYDKIPEYDMFLYTAINTNGKAATRVASLWGQMEEWALKHKAVNRTAETTNNLFKRLIDKKKIDDVSAGLEAIRELAETEEDDTDVWLMQIAEEVQAGKPARYRVPTPPTRQQIVDSDFRDQLTDGQKGDFDRKIAAGKIRPKGWGSVNGLLALTKTTDLTTYDPELIRIAIAFRDAIGPVHQLFVRIYGFSHPALDPNNVPSAFRVEGNTSADITANSIINLFTNLFDTNKSTLFLRRNGVNTGAGEAFAAIDSARYRGLSEAFEALGWPRQLEPAFGSAAKLAKFETEYSASPFAVQFARYQRDLRISQQQRARGGRRRGGAAPADQDEGASIALEGSGAGTSTLQELHEYLQTEVIGRNPSENDDARIVSFYSRLIGIVNEQKELDKVDLPALRALANVTSDFTGDEATGVSDVASRREFYATSFVASLGAIRNVSADVRLASPFNSGVPIDVKAASDRDKSFADGTGPNIDVTKMSIFTGHKGGGFGKGARDKSVYGVGIGAQAHSPFAGIRMPSFGSAEFQDIVGDELVTNKNLVDRFMHWGGVTDLFLRVCAQMFILAPITVHVLFAFKELNIAQPVAWLIEQPFRRYITTSAIFLSKPTNGPIGNIKWFDPDVHVGRNAINKNIMVHVSMYLGVTVDDVHNWLVAYDIAVVGYKGGETTKAFTLQTWKQGNFNTLGLDGPSLLYFMVPADSLVGTASGKAPFDAHDIRGYSDKINYQGNSVHRNSEFAKRPYYKSALYYCALLNLNALRSIQREDWFSFHTYRDGTHNTVTAQGLQLIYDPVTKQHDRCIMPQDVFKTNVYPGCRELRESLVPKLYKRHMDYEKRSIAV